MFLNSPACLLLHGMSLKSCEALERGVEAVFDRAAAFSMLLWCQRVAVKVSSLSELAAAKFKVDSLEVQAHATHVLDDPTDRRLDGHAIRIMVHPSVACVETHAADHEHSLARIFVKATVCLEP